MAVVRLAVNALHQRLGERAVVPVGLLQGVLHCMRRREDDRALLRTHQLVDDACAVRRQALQECAEDVAGVAPVVEQDDLARDVLHGGDDVVHGGPVLLILFAVEVRRQE